MANELFSMAGKVALITGASSGIGETLAKGLAQTGANVVVAARRKERLDSLVESINEAGGKAFAVSMDVTSRESIREAFDQAQAAMGVVDVLINNAGVADTKPFLKTDDESLEFVMGTNFGGVWHVAQEAAQRMVDGGVSGSIVNISSVLGLAAKPGYTSYCASKGAVIQLTRAMALDLGKAGIRVNAIAPGWFRTEINSAYFDTQAGQDYIKQMPARRLGDVQELIGPIILLCSDAGSFINGAVLPVDGAHSASGI